MGRYNVYATFNGGNVWLSLIICVSVFRKVDHCLARDHTDDCKYQLSAITAILKLDIGIDQNFHIEPSLPHFINNKYNQLSFQACFLKSYLF